MQCAFAPISSAASLYSVMYMSPLGRSAWRQRVLSLKLSLFIPRRAEVARRLADRAQPLLT
jgi:hypothetical protein